MRAHLLLALAVSALLGVTACGGLALPGQGRVSGLVGATPRGPQDNRVAPAPGKTVQFVPASGGSAQTATTGGDGRYAIGLDPGTYEVRLAGFAPVQLYYGRNPKTYGKWPRVTVSIGEESRVDLIYYSGIA